MNHEETKKPQIDEQKLKREQKISDMRKVLKTKEGRSTLWRYMANCDRISADASGSWTYFKEGERNIALQIKADVFEASPEAFLQMMQENKGDSKNV
jgi:hypothetical protein